MYGKIETLYLGHAPIISSYVCVSQPHSSDTELCVGVMLIWAHSCLVFMADYVRH